MKTVLRWYGEKDAIPLSYIAQIPGVTGVATAVYDTPVGEVWEKENILRLKERCLREGLSMEVIESVPVHEDIKLGKPSRDKYIAAYCKTLRNLSAAGVKCVCYNFMPVFDWLRTDLKALARDGSTSLAYSHEQLLRLNRTDLHLPGWDESYTKEELGALLEEYNGMSHGKLFENLVYFLERVLPVCDEVGIDMAIHPDDPPWDILGLPRIITGERGFDALFSALPNVHNGITFCTGSLGAARENDLPALAEKYADRIFFAHIRQLRFCGGRDFVETGHLTDAGDLDIFSIVRALVRGGFDGYVRPDHGRNIWGEDGKPGYGLYDRALGAVYLNGLFEAIEKEESEIKR